MTTRSPPFVEFGTPAMANDIGSPDPTNHDNSPMLSPDGQEMTFESTRGETSYDL